MQPSLSYVNECNFVGGLEKKIFNKSVYIQRVKAAQTAFKESQIKIFKR